MISFGRLTCPGPAPERSHMNVTTRYRVTVTALTATAALGCGAPALPPLSSRQIDPANVIVSEADTAGNRTVRIELFQPGTCTPFPEDVAATLNGAAMTRADRGGPDTDRSGPICRPAVFTTTLTSATLGTTAVNALVEVRDATATLRVQADAIVAAHTVVARGGTLATVRPGDVVLFDWSPMSAMPMSASASFSYDAAGGFTPEVALQGSAIAVTIPLDAMPGTGQLAFDAIATTPISRCEVAAHCASRAHARPSIAVTVVPR